MQALSQLSYSPELELRREVYRLSLVVPCRPEAHRELPLGADERRREVPTAVEREAVSSESVDLINAVGTSFLAVGGAPVAGGPDQHGVLAQGRPFALHAGERAIRQDEDEIEPTAFAERPKDLNAKARGMCRDGRLGDVAFLHCRQA